MVTMPTDICLGQSVDLTASGAASYTWSPATGLGTTTGSTVTASPAGTTTYTVTGTSPAGCTSTATVTITVIDPTASVTATPSTGMVPLTVDFDNTSGGSFFIWDFGNGLSDSTNAGSPDALTHYDTSGTYTVTLISIEGMCFDTTYLTIVVTPLSSIIVPNIITANGDGMNDEFKVQATALRSLNVQIFNRWGQLVGSISTPDGSWNGSRHNEGTYYYLLKAEGEDNEVYDMRGNFTLVK